MTSKSPQQIATEVKILLSLKGFNFVPVKETQILWQIDSKNCLNIDFSFDDPSLWELTKKEQDGKTKNYDWAKSPVVSPKIRDCILVMLDDFKAAKLAYFEEFGDFSESQKEKVTPENPIVNDQPTENPIDDLEKRSRIAKNLEDPEEEARKKREDAESRLREAEEAKEKEEAELEKLKKEKEASKPVSNDLYEEPDAPEDELPPVTKGEVKLLDILYGLIEDDLLQIFGHTGTGKTSIAMKAAFEARERKKSVIYIDTEHNITPKQAQTIKKLGIVYVYIPKFDDLYNYVKKLPKYEVVIVDSLGLPVLALFADANMKEKGVALQKMIAASAFLKNYANENHALVIVLNQPESDMNKDPNTERKPFGDKSSYCYKEIISSKFAKGGRTEKKTTVVVKAFRSRSCGMGTPLFNIEITDSGVKVIQ